MLCVCFYLRGQTQREKGRDRESALVLPNSPQPQIQLRFPVFCYTACLPKNAQRAILTKLPSWETNMSVTVPILVIFFFHRDKPSCPWTRETDQALNSHQVESCDVTSRHIFWANCFRSQIKTPPQLHADYEFNNTVNKCLFRQQFEESLSIFQLSKTPFLLLFTI